MVCAETVLSEQSITELLKPATARQPFSRAFDKSMSALDRTSSVVATTISENGLYDRGFGCPAISKLPVSMFESARLEDSIGSQAAQ